MEICIRLAHSKGLSNRIREEDTGGCRIPTISFLPHSLRRPTLSPTLIFMSISSPIQLHHANEYSHSQNIYLTIWKIFNRKLLHTFITPPPHLGQLVLAFLVFWGPTDYVYKIWLSLLKWPRFLYFGPPKKYFRYYRFILPYSIFYFPSFFLVWKYYNFKF